MDADDELSWEDKNRLYGISMIPFFAMLFALSIYFVYLMESNLLKSMWDLVVQIGLPLISIGLPASSLTFEVLHHRKIKKPLIFHVKRFTGRVLLILTSALSFFGFLAIINTSLSPIIGEEGTFIAGILIWLLAFCVVLTTSREFFTKLEKGEW
jgi:hypothetical protein